jgi:hypothetical protein
MADEVIKDYGEWKTPRGWNELTLKQFQDIERYYSDKDKQFDVREVLNLFTDHSVEEISQLPIDFVDKLLNELSWLQDAPEYGEARPYIDINGERYQVNVQEKLKTGEYIAVETAMKGDVHNYAAILAILCRKQGEIYDSHFENEVLPSRIELFERQPMMEVMPIVSFFLNLWLVLGKHTLLYSTVREQVDLTRKHIETLHKNGEISRRSMRSAMKELRKLEKSISSI